MDETDGLFSKKLTLLFQLLIIFILTVIIPCFLISVAVYMHSYNHIISWFEWIWLPVAILYVYMLVKISVFLQEKNEKLMLLFVSSFATVLYVVLFILYKTVPVSDYKVLWDSAIDMANNSYTSGFDKSHYMYIYNWQTGIAAFESLFIKIFGENFSVLKILNVILLNSISIMVYYLAKAKTDVRSACISYIFTVFFFAYFFTAPQFSNQHLGLPLLLAAFYCVEKKKYAFSALAGILLGLLNVVRPIAIISLVAVIVLWVFRAVKERKIAEPTINLVSVIVSYIIIILLFNGMFNHLEYTDGNVSQPKVTYFKFMKGLTNYNAPFEDLKELNFNYDAFNDQQKKELIEAITQNPVKTALFVTNKMIRFLGVFDYQLEHTFNHDENVLYNYPVKSIYMISWFQYIIYATFSLIGYINWRKDHELDIYQIFFVGYIFAHVFIEAVTSYRFIIYPFLLIMSGYGVKQFINGRYAKLFIKRTRSTI